MLASRGSDPACSRSAARFGRRPLAIDRTAMCNLTKRQAAIREWVREKPLTARIKELLSKPWIGRSISLVLLATSVTALTVSMCTYHRQGNRWLAEGARIAPKPGFSVGSLSVDGWSTGTLSVRNRLGVGLWLQKVQVIEPNDLHIAPQISIGDSSPDLAKAGDHIDLHQLILPPLPNSAQTFGIWSGLFYAKPIKDGEVITLQFELRGPDYPITWRIDVSSTVHLQR